MKTFISLLFSVLLVLIFCMPNWSNGTTLSDKELLGKKLFFDKNLSDPPGQSCATCHGPEVGWSGPDSEVNEKWGVYPGALHPFFGNRKPPSAAYSGMNPKLQIDKDGNFVGGMFWDGRATGWDLGDPLAEQAMGPFLNPLEQNIADKKSIVRIIGKSEYAGLFRKVWGKNALSLKDVGQIYIWIAQSVAAFERSHEVNLFNSKFDKFWKNTKSKGLNVEDIDESAIKQYEGLGLNRLELKGLVLFNTKGKCAECHVLTSENNIPPLFTDFTYDNLGVPSNRNNPFYTIDKKHNPDGKSWLDKGLGGFLQTTKKYKKYAKQNLGKHKVPTLRNVDLRPAKGFVKAFMHNGVFKTLKEVVNFYNTRDKKGAQWPKPEVKLNVNIEELGDLGLTSEEEDLIVLFMKTLSDQVSNQ